MSEKLSAVFGCVAGVLGQVSGAYGMQQGTQAGFDCAQYVSHAYTAKFGQNKK